MMILVRLTDGISCKACDKPLSDTSDKELCSECMGVVHQLNREIYDQKEEEAFNALIEATGQVHPEKC